jgi:hypothetical protein
VSSGVLEQVADGAGVDGGSDVGVRVVGGQDEYPHLGVGGTDGGGRGRAVHAGHLQVHQHDVGCE